MKILNEIRLIDQLYFQGPFWIVSDSMKDIHRGKFTLECKKILSDYHGNMLDEVSKNSLSHKNLWKNNLVNHYGQNEFDYFPRGRVAMYAGTAFIHLNSRCNIPSLIDKIIAEYELEGLEIEIEFNDELQGSHYDFKLE